MDYGISEKKQTAGVDAALDATPESASSRTALRGMSYADGAAALQPSTDSVQLKEGGPSGGETEATKKAEKEKEAERAAKAQADWEKIFGEAVGGFLFGKVREHVSPADLLGYGKAGTKAMAEASGGLFSATEGAGGMMDTKKEAAALNKMLGALGPKLQEMSNQWLASESGQKVLKVVSQYVEEHPILVVSSVASAAIGAAVAAYAANVDLPEFEQMFSLGGGLSVGGKVDFGKIQEMAVQTASLTVKYHKGNFKISATGSQDKDGAHSATISAEHAVTMGASSLEGKGKIKVLKDGSVELDVDGGMKTLIQGTPLELSLGGTHASKTDKSTVTGGLVIGDKDGTYESLAGEYDPGTGAFKLKTTYGADGMTASSEVAQDGDGNRSQTDMANLTLGAGTTLALKGLETAEGSGSSAKLSSKDIGGSGLSLSGGFGSGTLAGGSLGAGYKNDWLLTKLDFEFKPGASSLKTETTVKNDGFTFGTNLDVNLSSSRVDEFGLRFGYEDPKEFRGFLASYKRSWVEAQGGYSDDFDLKLETTLGKLATRFEGEVGMQGGNLMSAGASVTAGYPLNSEWMALGSLGWSASQGADGMMEHDPVIGMGVQYQDVGLMLNYHPSNDGNDMLSLGIVIPLGRRK